MFYNIGINKFLRRCFNMGIASVNCSITNQSVTLPRRAVEISSKCKKGLEAAKQMCARLSSHPGNHVKKAQEALQTKKGRTTVYKGFSALLGGDKIAAVNAVSEAVAKAYRAKRITCDEASRFCQGVALFTLSCVMDNLTGPYREVYNCDILHGAMNS